VHKSDTEYSFLLYNEDMENAIVFDAIVYKLQTLVDGGIRVTLDLSENSIPQMAMLAECKRSGIVLKLECSASGIKDEGRKNIGKRTYPYAPHE
jgi:hypothetical protein